MPRRSRPCAGSATGTRRRAKRSTSLPSSSSRTLVDSSAGEKRFLMWGVGARLVATAHVRLLRLRRQQQHQQSRAARRRGSARRLRSPSSPGMPMSSTAMAGARPFRNLGGRGRRCSPARPRTRHAVARVVTRQQDASSSSATSTTGDGEPGSTATSSTSALSGCGAAAMGSSIRKVAPASSSRGRRRARRRERSAIARAMKEAEAGARHLLRTRPARSGRKRSNTSSASARSEPDAQCRSPR